jgi:hypothetical protein
VLHRHHWKYDDPAMIRSPFAQANQLTGKFK